MKAAEDKTFPGAVAAALTSPWGQAVSAGDPANTYFGSYREVFARDLYEAWTAVFLAGDRRTAKDMTRFLFERQQQPDGSMPRNSLPNGKLAPDSFNTQLDECAYPLIMALAVGLTDNAYYKAHIAPAANFVASPRPRRSAPSAGRSRAASRPRPSRPRSPGLVAAAIIADRNGDHASARVWRGVADEFQRNLKKWTLTTNGPLGTGRYFIRLSKTGDPNAAITYNVGNGGPTLDQRAVIDAGFLEYARLGLLSADRRRHHRLAAGRRRDDQAQHGQRRRLPALQRRRLRRRRDRRPSVGALATRAPATRGRCSPASAASTRSTAARSAPAITRLDSMRNMSSGVGLIAEQAWDLPDLAASPFGTDPTVASIGFRNGKPDGSASALTWSAGQFVRLTLDAAAGKVLDRPAYTFDRYVRHTQGQTTLTVTAPADQTPVVDSDDGDRHHGARQQRHRGGHQHRHELHDDDALDDGRRRAAPSRSTIPLTGGTWVLNTVATSPSGGTARDVRTVVFDLAPGTLIFAADDPDGDDNGPGNFAYPTSDNFKPGRLRPAALRGLRRGLGHRLPRPHPRPDADVRQPARARSSSTSTSTCPAPPRPRRPPPSRSATT